MKIGDRGGVFRKYESQDTRRKGCSMDVPKSLQSFMSDICAIPAAPNNRQHQGQGWLSARIPSEGQTEVGVGFERASFESLSTSGIRYHS